MDNFTFYFGIGWEHIISLDALDHLLFILVLSAIYLVENWKKVLILVTAFTIGHSVTLVLSTLDIIRFNSAWVEFLIPLTIVITALTNLLKPGFSPARLRVNYFLALVFGLIHGMGFANTIRFMLSKSQDLLVPLLGFNLGLEAGQIVVVTLILLLAWAVVTRLGLPRKYWVWGLSAGTLLVSAWICVQRLPI
ncbi:MAG: HupE/UreJ family protein [Ferruginibacter sp.]